MTAPSASSAPTPRFPSELLQQPCPYVDNPGRLFEQLTSGRSNCLLLESAEIDSKDHLKSLLLLNSAMKIVCRGRDVDFIALTDNGRGLLPLIGQLFGHLPGQDGDGHYRVSFPHPVEGLDEDAKLKADSPLSALRTLVAAIHADQDTDEDCFVGGVFAYDLIASVEPLPDVPEGDNHCPDFLFYVAETLVVIDHQKQQARIAGQIYGNSDQHEAISQRLLEIATVCAGPLAEINSAGAAIDAEPAVNVSDADFRRQVSELKQEIVQGNIFQVVPSRTFSLPCPNPLGAYRQLKRSNPSPYMFYLKDEDFVLFGASPESALKYEQQSNQVEVYPIAGTRRRGFNEDGSINADLDSRVELDLRLDKKELAEHLMLVDLARNDIARIAQHGTRKVAELLKVDRYSHVMHLVSRVTGQLRDDLDALHAYQACMNMGTLVGAPKIRAAQLIRQVEGRRRGSYGGAVGYLNGRGDMDTCIVIRSAFVSQGEAKIQAGAGVVFDSDPQAEADETRSKAQAVISAIQAAGGFRD